MSDEYQRMLASLLSPADASPSPVYRLSSEGNGVPEKRIGPPRRRIDGLTGTLLKGENQKVAQGNGKRRYDLLPPLSMAEVADVFTFGADKYIDWGWDVGAPWSVYLAAAMRHIEQYRMRSATDPESGKMPLAHAVCCLMILIEYEKRGIGTDDRPHCNICG